MVKKTCILDLDETLIHSWSNTQLPETLNIYGDREIFEIFHPHGKDPLAYSFTAAETDFWGMYRPHLRQFLQFCDNYFDNVFIWSAGVPDYVSSVCECIFRDYSVDHPRAIWSRLHCDKSDGVYHKPIAKLMEHVRRKRYDPYSIDLSQTLIIDDKEYTFLDNPHNGILIPSYAPPENGDLAALLKYNQEDNAFPKLIKWMETSQVKFCTDVRSLEKKGIF